MQQPSDPADLRASQDATRRTVLQGGAALALAPQVLGQALQDGGARPRPNVLFIIADQHRHDAAGFAGSGHATTPNLDAFAAQATRLTDAYCQVPLCVPSRQSLLTGRYASSHGSFRNRHADNKGEQTFAHEFRAAGYRTGWIGKTHCNTGGFEHTVSQADLMQAFRQEHPAATLPEPPKGGRPTAIPTVRPMNPDYQPAREGDVFYMEEHVTREAARFLRESTQEAPFLCVASYLNPHPPLFPPADFLDLYRDAELPWVSDYEQAGAQPFRDLQRRRKTSRWQAMPLAAVRHITRAYYASVAWMDHCVGELLAELEASGHAQDTLVIYTSDHGEMLGQHGLWQKRALYDAACRVPLLMRWPDQLEAGRELGQVVEHLDLVRSMYELCGVTCGLETPGRSFAPLLRGRDQDWNNRARMELTATFGVPQADDLVSALDKPAAGFWALRQDEWKYIEHTPEERALFHIPSDPDEMVNRIHEPEQADRIEAMRAALVAGNPASWSFHKGDGQTSQER